MNAKSLSAAGAVLALGLLARPTAPCAAQEAPGDSLTVQEAVARAVSNGPLVREALEQVRAAEARAKERNATALPTVDGEFSYARIGPIPTFDFGGTSIALAPANNVDLHVSASQLVYDFGVRNARVEAARTAAETAADNVRIVRDGLAYRTVRSFYTLLFLQRSVGVADERIRTLERHIDVTRRKVASGSATDFDVLSTQVRVAEARNVRLDIDNAIDRESASFRALTGLPPGPLPRLGGDFAVDSASRDLDSLVRVAYDRRPELATARDAVRAAQADREAASRGDAPAVRVFGTYGVKNGFEPDLDALRGNWAAGIRATVPIFDGHRTAAQVEEDEAKIRAAEAREEEVRRVVRREVEQAAGDVRTNAARVATANIEVAQADEAVARAEVRYRDGVVTNLDLLDAETARATAELRALRVAFEAALNAWELRRAIGEPTAP